MGVFELYIITVIRGLMVKVRPFNVQPNNIIYISILTLRGATLLKPLALAACGPIYTPSL